MVQQQIRFIRENDHMEERYHELHARPLHTSREATDQVEKSQSLQSSSGTASGNTGLFSSLIKAPLYLFSTKYAKEAKEKEEEQICADLAKEVQSENARLNAIRARIIALEDEQRQLEPTFVNVAQSLKQGIKLETEAIWNHQAVRAKLNECYNELKIQKVHLNDSNRQLALLTSALSTINQRRELRKRTEQIANANKLLGRTQAESTNINQYTKEINKAVTFANNTKLDTQEASDALASNHDGGEESSEEFAYYLNELLDRS